MNKNGIALVLVGIVAAWNHTAQAQQPFFGPAYGGTYQSVHHYHHQPQAYYSQPSYGTYPAGYGYTPPVVSPVAPSYGGYGGYGGYGMGGYPNANYPLPQLPQPQYPYPPQPSHSHHHYHTPQPSNYQSHPWHLGHYLLGT